MFNAFGHVGGGELGATRYLPYIDHCADGRILCEHDAVVATIRASGAPYALTHRRERNAHVRRHVAWLNAIADDNVEVYEHLVKHNDPPPLGTSSAGRVALCAAIPGRLLRRHGYQAALPGVVRDHRRQAAQLAVWICRRISRLCACSRRKPRSRNTRPSLNRRSCCSTG